MGTMSGEEASPGLRETGIRERSPGSYELRAYNAEKGRQETTTYVHSRREWGAGIRTARSRRAQLVADIAAGKYGGSKGTLGYLVDAYIDQRERTGASPTTIRGYRSIARAVAAGPGPKKLDKLSSRDLDGWYADLIAGEMTPATVHHHHRLVFAALRQGRKWGWVASNTAELATVPKVPRSELKVPPPARVVALIDHAELSRAPDMATIIVTAALTGLRRGELCGLRWSDIDWHGQTITVQAPIDTIPLFVRAGSILPLGAPVESTHQQQAIQHVRVYPGADANFTLFSDDGQTYAYENGAGSITNLQWDDATQKLTHTGPAAWTKPDTEIVQIAGH